MNAAHSANPAITVVMPVYNREASVARAIESVLRQFFCEFELVIIDDASTDQTPNVVAKFDDPRIRYLRQPQNQGGNAARNRGIASASAHLISFIDSDDEFLPHKLGYVVDYFERNRDIDVLLDSYKVVYPSEANRPEAPRMNPILRTSAEVERAVFARKVYKATPALSARRDALVKAGLFDETLKRRQDMDFILRLAQNVRCATTNDVLWTKYWSEGSISARANTFMYAMIEMCKRHPQYLSRPEFKIGLARDMARHFIRLAAHGDFSTLATDARRFAEFDGKLSLAKLVAQGLCEHLRRKIRKRADSESASV